MKIKLTGTMKPASPVVPGLDLPETVYAKDQPPYLPLAVVRCPENGDGAVLMRWHMSWADRLTALWRGDVYVRLLTFDQPLQPILLFTERPE